MDSMCLRIGASVGMPFEIPMYEFEHMDMRDIAGEIMMCWNEQLPFAEVKDE